MAESPEKKPPVHDWRFALTVGISIGFGMSLSRGVMQALESGIGHWGAFLVSVVAAAVGGGLAALLTHWLLHRGDKGGP
jgi:hypothetical protein